MRLQDHFIAVLWPFPVDGEVDVPGMVGEYPGWTKGFGDENAALITYLRGKYYPHFMRFVHPTIDVDSTRHEVFRPVKKENLVIGGVVATALRHEIHLFKDHVGLFTLVLKLEGENIDLGDVGRVAGAVRDPATTVGAVGRKFTFGEYVGALLSRYGVGSDGLFAFGPNLKVFTNAILAVDAMEDAQWDEHLFELSNGLPVGGMHGSDAPTDRYMREQIAMHGIQPFRNWKALALTDTFTRLALKSEDPHSIWERDYMTIFQYVHALRAHALGVARGLASLELSDVSLLDERDGWHTLRNETDLGSISYKWLPNEVFRAMVKGTGLRHEIEQADDRMQRMVLRFKERRSRNLHKVGLVLAAVVIVLLALLFTRGA